MWIGGDLPRVRNRQNKRQLASLDRLLAEGDSPSVAERAPYALIAVIVLTAATVALTFWLSLGGK